MYLRYIELNTANVDLPVVKPVYSTVSLC